MRQDAILRFTVVAAGVFSACAVSAQKPVSLQEQLNAQYKLVKIGADGDVVGDPGTLLATQKGGLIAVPWKSHVWCSAKFENNELHVATGFCAGMMRNVAKVFKKDAKVYPVKVEVNLDKAKISFQVVRCSSCYSEDPAPWKAEVVFEFAKGYLEKANASEVEEIIGQVFTITTNDDQQAQNGENGDGPQADQQQPAQQEQQPEPKTVQMGMTADQVQAALGKPDKIFNLDTKQIYVYKDVKVTFMNGKVADVQ